METIVLNAHLEPSSTMLPKSVFMFVEKTLPTILSNKNVFVLLDTESLIKFVLNVPLTTSFKTIIVLLAQLTQFYQPPPENVNVLMDSC